MHTHFMAIGLVTSISLLRDSSLESLEITTAPVTPVLVGLIEGGGDLIEVSTSPILLGYGGGAKPVVFTETRRIVNSLRKIHEGEPEILSHRVDGGGASNQMSSLLPILKMPVGSGDPISQKTPGGLATIHGPRVGLARC